MNQTNSKGKCQISWYGRCCFLVLLNNKRILFDPYDTFCNVDMGMVDAEILISSSTWHDHGHIGASPGAWVFTYQGSYDHLGLKITGMEVKEKRGSPTVVFNLVYENFSITNFADMGVYGKECFTSEQTEILKSTNIAFVRSGHEKVLDFCNPEIIVPEHYFPERFVENQVPTDQRSDFELQNKEIDKMIRFLGYPVEGIDGFQYQVGPNSIDQTKIVRFLDIHPQVKYLSNIEIKRYW